ncbi:peroxiredoxin [Laribacter hongkongensis]|uniref:peroxiredoxin n=1 Tax=Laribacter hongkongensis TaxID=168471 RepID=UPI001EFEF091|nr:peroxiredoxin [Laribacter hongkongensis]MCG9096758.1 peroxiredoxin [Laribacter hongkongensis]
MQGTPCPDFSLPATGDTTFTLAAARKPLVLYFYPKDNTPGCSNEAQAFAALHADFEAAGCEVAGISRDSLKSHENFRAKFDLPFPLLSDPDETVCNLFGVIKLKNMYGKQVRGIERSTFLIGEDGRIEAEWRGVKVPGHAEAVLAAVRAR